MKSSTQLLFLLLYPATRQTRFVVDKMAEPIVCGSLNLTPAGWRSLVNYLIAQGFVESVTVPTGRQLNLTPTGRAACEGQFPALSPSWRGWNNRWLHVVFREAPTSDRQFRSLRSKLLQLGALAVSRGNYLLPSLWSSQIETVLGGGYEHTAIVFEIDHWQFTSEQSTIASFFNLSDLAVGYSGVSSEIDVLLRQFGRNKKRADRQKQRFSTVFYRFWEVLGDDPGFLSTYIPSAPSASVVLARLQQVFDEHFQQ